MDFNHDGKLDLFVSGRVDPWSYPRPVSSFIFRNDSENGHVKFTDVTDEVAPALRNIGMIFAMPCSQISMVMDKTDLIVVGEWTPIIFLKNVNAQEIRRCEPQHRARVVSRDGGIPS